MPLTSHTRPHGRLIAALSNDQLSAGCPLDVVPRHISIMWGEGEGGGGVDVVCSTYVESERALLNAREITRLVGAVTF